MSWCGCGDEIVDAYCYEVSFQQLNSHCISFHYFVAIFVSLYSP